MRRDRNPFKNRAKTSQTLVRLPDALVHGGLGAYLLKSSLDDADLRALTPPPSADHRPHSEAIQRPFEDSQIPASRHQQPLDLADDKRQNQRQRDGGHQGCEYLRNHVERAGLEDGVSEPFGWRHELA